MFAHVYCPNFLIQCERLFRPELASQAVVIYQCVASDMGNHLELLAASEQAHELGFRAGLSSDQLNQRLEQFAESKTSEKLVRCSPNSELYSDMSERLFTSLEMLASTITPISNDEAGFDFSKIPRFKRLSDDKQGTSKQETQQFRSQLESFVNELRASIKQWLGLEIFVGVGQTKTLAHLACKAAERQFDHALHLSGTITLVDKHSSRQVLANFPVSMIDGIGAKSASKLSELGIHTALELSEASSHLIGKRCSLLVEHIALELMGLTSQFTGDETALITASNEIATSASNIEIHEAVASYTKAKLKGRNNNTTPTALIHLVKELLCNAHNELCQRQLSCLKITLVLEKCSFSTRNQAFTDGRSISLREPSEDLALIGKLYRQILENIYRADTHYTSVSVTLECKDQHKTKQANLFEREHDLTKTTPLSINGCGSAVIRRHCELYDSLDDKKTIKMRQRLPTSPSFTTQWHDLLLVN